jgi:DHA1 family tetracycline resistance protein-like MFS transporter
MKKNSAVSTVFLVVLVDLMGFGLVLPLLPFYAGEFNVGTVEIGILYSIYSAAQLVFSPIWGSLSDRFGRRPIMLISTFGGAVSYILFGLSGNYTMLLFSRLLAGIMGGNIAAAQAYIADVTKPEERAAGMGLIGAAFGIGFVVGPALAAGLLHPSVPAWFEAQQFPAFAEYLRLHKYENPGFFAGILSFVSFLLVAFKLPETVKNSSTAFRRIGVFTADFWRDLWPTTSKNKVISRYLLATLIMWISQGTLFAAFPLFCDIKLGLPAESVGFQFFYLGLISAVMQGFFIRKLSKSFQESSLFMGGAVISLIGMATFPFVETASGLPWALLILAVGNSLILPTLSSLISKESKPDEVGSTLGTAQSVAGIGRVLGPTWGGFLIAYGANIPFYANAILLSLAVLVAFKIKKHE